MSSRGDKTFRELLKERKERKSWFSLKTVLIVVGIIVLLVIAFWIYSHYNRDQSKVTNSESPEKLEDSQTKEYLSNLTEEEFEDLISRYGKSEPETD